MKLKLLPIIAAKDARFTVLKRSGKGEYEGRQLNSRIALVSMFAITSRHVKATDGLVFQRAG